MLATSSLRPPEAKLMSDRSYVANRGSFGVLSGENDELDMLKIFHVDEWTLPIRTTSDVFLAKRLRRLKKYVAFRDNAWPGKEVFSDVIVADIK